MLFVGLAAYAIKKQEKMDKQKAAQQRAELEKEAKDLGITVEALVAKKEAVEASKAANPYPELN